eukprot:366131-Chlamydomonas_euryale.AAC.34
MAAFPKSQQQRCVALTAASFLLHATKCYAHHRWCIRCQCLRSIPDRAHVKVAHLERWPVDGADILH